MSLWLTCIQLWTIDASRPQSKPSMKVHETSDFLAIWNYHLLSVQVKANCNNVHSYIQYLWHFTSICLYCKSYNSRVNTRVKLYHESNIDSLNQTPSDASCTNVSTFTFKLYHWVKSWFSYSNNFPLVYYRLLHDF